MDRAAIDELADAREWRRHAVEACLETWLAAGGRYQRRLRRRLLLRSASRDVFALAARRVVPLPRRVVRPLPDDELPALALDFNRLDRADRAALLAWAAGRAGPAGVDARIVDEHRASALQRLVESRLQTEARRPSRP